jgi:uncharacterized protein YndB with AHSA1/START domain
MNNVTHTTAELAELDSVARQIDIDAPPDRVWDLVVRPGWYVNDGTIAAEPELRHEGDVTVVVDPELGESRFRTVRLDKPRYAAFRWLHAPYPEASEGTLVEFWVDERADGGVTLRVLESGFSRLSEDVAVWLEEREAHDRGWTQELASAKAYVEAGGS